MWRLTRIERLKLGTVGLLFCFAILSLTPIHSPFARQLGEIIIEVLPSEQSRDDRYWPWLVKYVDDRVKAEARIDAIFKQLSVQARRSAELRTRWMAFFREEYGAARLAPEPVLRRERNRIKGKIDALKAAQRPLVKEALDLYRRIHNQVRVQSAWSGDRRPELKEELQLFERLRPLLRIELYDAAEWYREDELPALFKKVNFTWHMEPELARYYKARSDIAHAKALERRILAQVVAANRRGVNPQFVERMRTLRLGALKDMRLLAAKRPDLEKVRVLIQEEELYWVRQVAKKVESQANLTLSQFRAFLSTRGYSASDQGGWPQGVLELFTAWYGSGPIALAAGIYNMPATKAQIVGLAQAQSARNIIALNTIIRLIKNGVRLTELSAVRAEDLRHKVSLRRADRRPLTILRARELVVDIHRTLRELPDLKALTSSEPFYFAENVAEKFAENYFEAIDSDYHSYEYFGDILNIRNLLMFWGPGAITQSVGNRLGFATQAQIAAAHAKGATVGHKIFAASGLKWYAETFRQTGVGEGVARMLLKRRDMVAVLEKSAYELWAKGGKSNRALAALSGSAYAMTEATSMVAVLGTMFGAHYLASMTELDALVLLVDMISIFQLDTHFLEVAFRANLPLGKIAAKLEDATHQVKAAQQTVQRARAVLDDAATGARSARGVSAAGRAPLKTGLRPEVPKNPVSGVNYAATKARQARNAGDVAEAQRAATAGKQMADRADDRLSKAAVRIDKARKRVASASKKSSVAISPSKLPKAKPIGGDTAKLGKKFYNDKFYKGTAGGVIEQGDLAIHADNLDEALKHYQRAYKKAVKHPRLDRDLNDFLEERIALLFNARQARKHFDKLRKGAPRVLKAKQPITLDEEKLVRQAIEKGNIREISGGANPLYEVTDPDTGIRFLVKKMDPNPKEASEMFAAQDALRRAIESGDQTAEKLARKALTETVEKAAETSERKVRRELFGAAVMNELGLNAPANRRLRLSGVKVRHQRTVSFGGKDRTINVEEALEHAVIMRPVDDFKEVFEMTEAEVLALRKDIGEQRAVRALIGDSDGHLRNMVVDKNGVFWNIDFDYASISGTRFAQGGGTEYANEAELMEAVILLAHGRFPGSKGAQAGFVNHGLYSPMSRADEMIRLQDLKAQLDRIENFDPDKMSRRLQDAGFDSTEIESLMQILDTRKNLVRPTLGDKKYFGDGPIKFSWIWLLQRTRHALRLAPEYRELHPANDNATRRTRERRAA